ncbi:NUDIX domain-containing protein [Streptomyces sp. NPDC058683]|uniref:NUDIX domain-containing protein n=1 Tax=Streptomyces sp. NPDC058683 TaxID=3346597 RepID=UPI00366008A7
MAQAADNDNWFDNPPPRRVGTHALVLRGSRMLMVTRPYSITVSQWGMPGGSAGPNELPWRTLSRSLAERLELRVTPGRLLAADHVPATPGKHDEGVNYVYEVHLPDNVEPVVTEAGRFGEARWVERAAIEELAVDHSLRRIQQCLKAAETGQFLELLLGLPRQSVGDERG